MKLTKSKEPLYPEPGVYYDVTWDEYCRWDAFSQSMVESALRSGKHLESFIANGKDTASLRFGSLIDTAILEPQLMNSSFVTHPSFYEKEIYRGRGKNKALTIEKKPWSSRSNTCKSWVEDAERRGLSVVSNFDMNEAQKFVDAVNCVDEIRDVLRDGKRQVSMVWVCRDTQLLCKARMDLLHDSIWDLKTSCDASPESFGRSAAKFNYHVQAGTYSMAFRMLTGEKKPVNYIVVEADKKCLIDSPQVALYELRYDDETMGAGRLKFRRACMAVKSYGDNPTGYSKFIEPLEFPRWEIEKEYRIDEQ